METQIKLENVSAIQKKFIVTIPAEKVTKTVEKKYIEAQRTASIKGFRPGKVPLNMVKQYYGEDVRNRALNTLINETYSEAIKKHPMRIVGDPQIEGLEHDHGDGKTHTHLHLNEGEAMTYVALVEVVPEIDPKDYKGLTVEKISPDVTKEDVEAVKKNLLERKAEVTPVERAARMGDFVDFKFDGKLKTGKEFVSDANLSGDRQAEIGSGQLIPDFELNLVGMKSGDTKTFKMKYPKDFKDEKLAGKEAEYEVSMREVKEKNIPSWSEELAKEFGYKDIADFETKTKEGLTKQKADDADTHLRNSMIEKLIEKNNFDVPQGLVYSQIRALADDYTQELKRYGFNDQMAQQAVVSQLADFKKRAETQVRAGILLDSIAKKEKIEPKESDIEVEVAKMAGSYGVEPKMLKDRFEQNPRDKQNFEYRVREELTIQFILNSAKIKEKK
ncbi:MAG: trigger factor [Bdellovibrionales bacterium]|nr:trigger factor [Bdellovibrionales bacterium]